MEEPAKVDSYYKVGTFLIGKTRWWILKHGRGVVITRSDNAFVINKEAGEYALLYDKTVSFNTSKSKNELQLVIMDEFRITTVRKGGFLNDRTDKKNDTKI